MGTNLRYTFNGTSDSEDPLMNSRNDLADAGFDAGLLAQFRDIFASFSDDNTSVFGADEGT